MIQYAMSTIMDQNLYRLRPATPDDAPGIAAVHNASIAEIGAQFYPPDVVEAWGYPRDPQKYVESMEKGEVYFVVEPVQSRFIDTPHHGKVLYLIGVSSYGVDPPEPGARDAPEHHLRMLYMRPEGKGRGIARALYQAVEDFARVNGAPELHIGGSLAGLAFYKAMGHTEVSRYQHPFKPYPGKAMEAVKLVKSLHPQL